MTFDVIIPTYKPGKEFRELLEGILIQKEKPARVIVINTEEAYWNKDFEKILDFELIHIKRQEFDHGGTRRRAACLVTADFFVCMTQDARPKNDELFSSLLRNFDDEKVAIAYARQETDEKASPLEAFTRRFNYPPQRRVKTKEDVKELGIKAWFSSDVCAMYRKSAYLEAGGFVKRAIFNEDMLMAYEVMERGYKVVYEAKARVIHYHEYSAAEQFHRNFDLGVSHREYSHIFSKVSSEKEGGRYLKRNIGFLLKTGRLYLLPKLFFHTGAKYLGYRLGKEYHRLPKWMVNRFSMNKGYFK